MGLVGSIGVCLIGWSVVWWLFGRSVVFVVFFCLCVFVVGFLHWWFDQLVSWSVHVFDGT